MVSDKRSKRKHLKDTVDKIPISNKFEALSSAPEELEVRSKERVPPIVVNGTINDQGRPHGSARIVREEQPPIPHVCLQRGKKEEVGNQGLTASAPVGEILEDVRQTIPGVVQVIKMTKTDGNGRKRVLPTFILITNAEVTQKDFKNLVIYSHYVQVQKYTTEEAVTRCYRCQLFGHSSRYCNLQQTCVRCAGNHRASECDRVHKEAAERKGFQEEVKSRVRKTMKAAGQEERSTAAPGCRVSESSNANGKKDSRNNAVARPIAPDRQACRTPQQCLAGFRSRSAGSRLESGQSL
ncbi:hypothetical protein AAG570_013254 [Ranatra chinensis]|uniref:Gag-like protein n=1 Tax=Ranatra chinensis TaxID=642074 RepID=A0ABD0YG76_9HEMI